MVTAEADGSSILVFGTDYYVFETLPVAAATPGAGGTYGGAFTWADRFNDRERQRERQNSTQLWPPSLLIALLALGLRMLTQRDIEQLNASSSRVRSLARSVSQTKPAGLPHQTLPSA